MTQHRPVARRGRVALALVAGLTSMSLLPGVLCLFHSVEPGLPWTGLEASPTGVDPPDGTTKPFT